MWKKTLRTGILIGMMIMITVIVNGVNMSGSGLDLTITESQSAGNLSGSGFSLNVVGGQIFGSSSSSSLDICIGYFCFFSNVSCGNAVCDSSEDCNSCSQDCGNCPITPVFGRSSAGIIAVLPAITVKNLSITLLVEKDSYIQGEEIWANITLLNERELPISNPLLTYYLMNNQGIRLSESTEQLYIIPIGETRLRKSLISPIDITLGEWGYFVEYSSLNESITASDTVSILPKSQYLVGVMLVLFLSGIYAIHKSYTHSGRKSESEEKSDV